MSDELIIWTIYDHPKDYPDCFVARAFNLDQPTDRVLTAPTLRDIRALLPFGLYCLPRCPEDAAVIVETWL